MTQVILLESFIGMTQTYWKVFHIEDFTTYAFLELVYMPYNNLGYKIKFIQFKHFHHLKLSHPVHLRNLC